MTPNTPKSSLIVLPCRYGSTRLKRKHLIELPNGKTIFEMAYERCKSSIADEVIIATDHREIYDRAEKFGAKVVMTGISHNTGTDRVAEVARNYPEFDIVLNVQGDEPLVSVNLINDLIKATQADASDAVMYTGYTKFKDQEQLNANSTVKVVKDFQNRAIYFSRSKIPFIKEPDEHPNELDIYNKHLGLYSYKRDFLLKYADLEPGVVEDIEGLEQIRILEHGFKIGLVYTEEGSFGIDTASDIERLKKYL